MLEAGGKTFKSELEMVEYYELKAVDAFESHSPKILPKVDRKSSS